MITYERIYPPNYMDKTDPKCPECVTDKMFFVGTETYLSKGETIQHKLYQCSFCRRLYREIKDGESK